MYDFGGSFIMYACFLDLDLDRYVRIMKHLPPSIISYKFQLRSVFFSPAMEVYSIFYSWTIGELGKYLSFADVVPDLIWSYGESMLQNNK
jgi:hypothetical protein